MSFLYVYAGSRASDSCLMHIYVRVINFLLLIIFHYLRMRRGNVLGLVARASVCNTMFARAVLRTGIAYNTCVACTLYAIHVCNALGFGSLDQKSSFFGCGYIFRIIVRRSPYIKVIGSRSMSRSQEQ